ncbi:MAG: sugar phosphate isomerase/epimerase [Bacteroidetes bacterium]|nr:sugar phosphate isomerase/epimerase [Bacteroidota bacterium]
MIKYSNRREFIRASTLLMASTLAIPSFASKKKKALLSFSTLGCPDWSLDQIIEFAAKHDYNGIEVRGIQREMDLTKCPAFNSATNRQAYLKKMADQGLHFVDLGSSATMHFADPTVRKRNLDEGKRFIDLAQQLDCPFVRVFPNNLPKDQDKVVTMDLIAQGIKELADHAKGSKVTVLMETHGDLVKAVDIEELMQKVNHPKAGLVWDIANMWTITKESPAEVYPRLKKFIRHTHIKDAKLNGDKIDYALLGQGDVPIFEAIDLLSKDGYVGYYSFEWEKLWHPEIAAPELAIADYSKVMRAHLGE